MLLSLLSGSASALTISLDLEALKDQTGALMPVSGLVVLTAATSGTFYGPTPSSFAGGDELILKKWNLDLPGFALPGVFEGSTGDLQFSGGWTVGDLLKVYWYPTLNLGSPSPGAGTRYGAYRDTLGVDGSAPWVTPSANSTVSLKFFTSDATFLSAGGSNAADSGRANFVVLPEPGSMALSVAALGLLWPLTRRRSPGRAFS